MIKLIYIAGRFRGPTFANIKWNIDVAGSLRAPIARLKAMPICVHVGEGLEMHDINQDDNGSWWLESTMEVLRRCDAVVLAPGWQSSTGTYAEIKEAMHLGLPVFESTWNTAAQAYNPTGDDAVGMPVLDLPRDWYLVTRLYGTPGEGKVVFDVDVNFAQWVAEQSTN